MGWKNLPSWLKGGIILSLISLIASFCIVLLIMIEAPNSIIETPLFLFALIFSFFTAAYYFGTGMGVANSSTSWPSDWFLTIFLLLILSLVIYFIIGSLIGWIVGKIKSRGQNGKKKI